MQVQYYAVNLFFDQLTTVVNKSNIWLTAVQDELFTELFIQPDLGELPEGLGGRKTPSP